MKITKKRLKQLIKEELEEVKLSYETDEEYEARRGKSGPATELQQSYTFNIYRPGHYRSDRSITVMYAENVPMSMIDTKDYERNKVTHKDPERFLKISKEGLQRLGLEANEYGNFGVDMYVVDQVPETIELTVPYNPRSGEFMTDQVKPYMIPKVVDASSM